MSRRGLGSLAVPIAFACVTCGGADVRGPRRAAEPSRVCGGEVVVAGDRELCLHRERLAFADAQATCAAEGGELATIEDARMQAGLLDALRPRSAAVTSSFWIGLFEPEPDRWMWASRRVPRFGAWGQGEPNDQGGVENCAEILRATGQWNDLACNEQRAYACESVRGQQLACTGEVVRTGLGEYCLNTSSPRPWVDAREACIANGGRLAELATQEENAAFAAALSPSVNRLYIGLSDERVEGSFRWRSGAPLLFTSFLRGEPNDAGGGEDCVEIVVDRGGWNDVPCQLALPFVCEPRP